MRGPKVTLQIANKVACSSRTDDGNIVIYLAVMKLISESNWLARGLKKICQIF